MPEELTPEQQAAAMRMHKMEIRDSDGGTGSTICPDPDFLTKEIARLRKLAADEQKSRPKSGKSSKKKP